MRKESLCVIIVKIWNIFANEEAVRGGRQMKPMIGMAILGVALLAGQAFADEQAVLSTPADRENYTNGVTIARNLKQQGGAVNLDILIKGMMDELRGEKLLMTEEDILKTLTVLQAESMQKKTQAAMKRGEVKAGAGNTAAAANTGPNNGPAARKEAQAQKPAPDGQAAQIAPAKPFTSVAERYTMRRAIKNRAAEMRRKVIEQGRQGAI